MSSGVSTAVGGQSGDMLLALAITGGDDFRKRLAQLLEAKGNAEKAFNDLRLGNDAVKVYEESEAARAEAKTLLTAARAEAKELKAAASEAAKKTRDEAHEALKLAQDQAKAIVDEAKLEAGRVASEIKTDQSELKRQIKEAQTKVKDLEASRGEARSSKSASEKAAKDSEEVKAKYEALISRIKQVVGEA